MLWAVGEVRGQSIGIGFGIGLPLKDYIVNDLSYEFRVNPEAGYYGILRDLSNANGSAHFNVSFLMPVKFFNFLDDIEIRLDAARFVWAQSEVKYSHCQSLGMDRGQIDPSHISFVSLKHAECIDFTNYNRYRSLRGESLDNLWFWSIVFGARYRIVDMRGFIFFTGLHIGGVVGIYEGSGSFGGIADVMLGVSYAIGDIVSVEFGTMLKYLLTRAPGDRQKRMNIESQTGGNIWTSMFQDFSFVDFQLSLRLAIQ